MRNGDSTRETFRAVRKPAWTTAAGAGWTCRTTGPSRALTAHPTPAARVSFREESAGIEKTFSLPETLRGRRILVEFDGVYRDSDVWINGYHLGHRPYGYSSFEYDLTSHVNLGTTPNLLAVRVDHSAAADSRWYTGSGIYRNVWLTVTEPIHVAHWGTYVRTPVINDREALVSVETTVVNESNQAARVRLVTAIEDESGREAGSFSGEEQIGRGASHTYDQQGKLEHPLLWSIESPHLYTAVTKLYANGNLTDEYRTPFGVRTLRFDPNQGFFLNGQPLKFKGVCMHHDLGALGAAFSSRRPGAAPEDSERTWRQRDSRLAQPDGPGMVRTVRPHGISGHGRSL